jgi:3-polyprenyl-4-hydroxybenzoate decarboxylase
MITPAERVSEQRQISEVLEKVYQKQKPLILNDLKTILAYQHLANVTDTKTVLQPVHKLKSRDELLAQDLEVWPADFKEEWLDEVGKHVLIGESLCKPDK